MKPKKLVFKFFIQHYSFKSILFLVVLLTNFNVFSQIKDSLKNELFINFETRPRAEFRDHYKTSPTSTLSEFYVSQRNRLNITFQTEKIKFHVSPQEIHLWNKSGYFSTIGSFNFHEFYLKTQVLKNFSVKIGRQGFLIDNGRLFSDAPWAQQSRSHEGVRFFYEKNKINTDVTVFTTRNYSDKYDQKYSPVAAHHYKYLFAHHLKYKLSENYTLLLLNYSDIFENETYPSKEYYFITNGGGVKYEKKDWKFTFNGYFQSGKTHEFRKLRAYYFQPEIATTISKTTLRLGAEIMSGSSSLLDSNYSYAFVISYGVAWKFMGNMNFFTRFPNDLQERGLNNPYLFVIHKVNDKLSLRSDFNLFFTQYPLVDGNKNPVNRYIGFEHNLSFEYKPIKNVNIRYGFSYMMAEESMELLGKVKNSKNVPIWSYLMIAFEPELFKKG